MIWKKDPKMKYTDMCIYIDAHIREIYTPGENPETEATIYNYLWLLAKALAIKKNMFPNFQDYDGYAFYAANRLFFALRKNMWNQGKTIKGKLIRPIKSCLNYTKALLYPMKIEYQRDAYKQVISSNIPTVEFNEFAFKEKMRAEAKDSQDIYTSSKYKYYLSSSLTAPNLNRMLDRIIDKSPFSKSITNHKYLKITLLLNTLTSFREKGKLNPDNKASVILWKLPRSMNGYIQVLLNEFYIELRQEITACFASLDIKDELADAILTPPIHDGEYDED